MKIGTERTFRFDAFELTADAVSRDLTRDPGQLSLQSKYFYRCWYPRRLKPNIELGMVSEGH